jgi:protein O-GlcNAc transferase
MPRQAKTVTPLAQTVQQALTLHRQGRLAEAERLYRAALAKQPRQFEALHFLGVLELQQGHAREALELLHAATKAKPDAAEVRPSLGAALAALGRHEEALAVYDGILHAKPDDADAGYNRGVVLSHLGRHPEALESYDKVLASRPGHVGALFNRGNVLAMFRRFDEALASYDRAIALAPRHIDALTNRADALKALERHDEAIAAYDRVLRIVPEHADALNNRGNALFALKRYDEAIASLNAALAVKPNDPDMLFNLGRALQEVDRDDAALAAFDRVLTARPENADAWYSRGNSSLKLKRTSDAIADYERALALAPDHPHAFDVLLRVRLDACEWQDVARLTEEVPRRVAGASSAIHPLKLLCLPVTPAIQLRCARKYVSGKTRGLQIPSANFGPRDRDKLRVAYLSADFRVHAVATLIAELFELHDRARFEVLAISFGPDDGSQMRSRIVQSVDQFHDVSAHGDLEIAKLIKDLEVDIAVDLMGHTRHARIGILAPRPAPVQTSYLGYPGTTGADFIDYVIADPIVLPFADQPFYSERIVHVPDCYQVNDRRRAIASQVPTRWQAGLPEQAFVFCCFNNSFKITAEVFEVWMRLLRQVDASVLWVLECNEVAGGNLRREAEARSIDPARLIFAPFVDAEVNLARLSLADLFLDTLPYNGHTTASDALWAGLPLLTCAGRSFAGRVAASLLHAAGLPQLTTRNLEEYEALALKLAAEPSLLQSIRRKLAANRLECPLFDTDRFRRHIEAAYATMWDIYRRGEAPRSFKIEPL